MNPLSKNREIRDKITREEIELEFKDDQIFEELFQMIRILTRETSWNKNISIVNLEEEKRKFQKAREKEENWDPNFEFKHEVNNYQALKKNIDQCIKASERISSKNLKDSGFEVLEAEVLQEFFKESFREMNLYVKLAENIEDREAWREISEEIWPMVSKDKYENSLEKVQTLENNEKEKELDAEDVKRMFEREIERLGFDYNVEIRKVKGCHNIPDERTLVVARGVEEERLYSEEEAEMLTKHEVFHVVRGINGRNISEKFPQVLGVHSPFYDQTEEGGAVFREQKTGTNYEAKDFDYHLRLIAAFKLSQGEAFQDVVESLIELGGSLDRSFYLVARNRQALRHHIYLSGVNDWKRKDLEKLLIGKLNSEWAEVFWKEVKKGSFNRPKITSEVLFK